MGLLYVKFEQPSWLSANGEVNTEIKAGTIVEKSI